MEGRKAGRRARRKEGREEEEAAAAINVSVTIAQTDSTKEETFNRTSTPNRINM